MLDDLHVYVWCVMDIGMVQRIMAVLIMLVVTYMYFYEDDDEE
jgi:hypothetical protein